LSTPASAAAEPVPVAGLAVSDLVVERREAGRAVGPILDRIGLSIGPGAFVAVTGPSGAGKTTLLHAIAGLLRPTAGSLAWDGVDIGTLPEAARDRWRRDTVGLVFQDFQLFAELGVLQNILLPMAFDHVRVPAAAADRAKVLAERVGLHGRGLVAGKLSRGEQQRVAIARALMRAPRLVLADEPTASLDAATGTRIADLLIESCRESGAALVVVSHDPALIARADRRLRLSGGRLEAMEAP
jgi:putative ABC transport system ATP-binding protein